MLRRWRRYGDTYFTYNAEHQGIVVKCPQGYRWCLYLNHELFRDGYRDTLGEAMAVIEG